jgi:hypothetical protein
MITVEKTAPEMYTYWFASIILIVVLGMYGRQAIEWVLMKLYEYFVANTPIKI